MPRREPDQGQNMHGAEDSIALRGRDRSLHLAPVWSVEYRGIPAVRLERIAELSIVKDILINQLTLNQDKVVSEELQCCVKY